MSELFNKARTLLRNRTTYQVGLLQARVYRVLKQKTNGILAPFGISSLHFAMLGLLKEKKEGLMLQDIAQALGVEPPFVSELLRTLTKCGWVVTVANPKDKRAKVAELTPDGLAFLVSTERHTREHIRPLLTGISSGDIATYLSVLEKISKNADRQSINESHE